VNDSREARCRDIAVSTTLLLLALVFAWQCFPVFTGGNLLRAIVFGMPLMLPLPGLVRRHRTTYRWATLCVLPYFVVAITEAFANPVVRSWAVAMLALALIWFFALVAFLRVSGERDSTN
jgi:uncharacterized membrane protein